MEMTVTPAFMQLWMLVYEAVLILVMPSLQFLEARIVANARPEVLHALASSNSRLELFAGLRCCACAGHTHPIGWLACQCCLSS